MKYEDAWASVDPLGEALHFLRMSGIFYCRAEFSAPWGLVLPPMKDSLMFHFVTTGRCWLEVEGMERRQLQRGDLALVPHGEGHRLTSEPGVFAAKLFDLPRELLSERYEILRHGDGGVATNMVCGAVRFDHPAAHHLAKLLPRMICIDVASSPHMDWINSTLRFMAAEARELRPGGETVITRLADILVVQTIRAWLEQDPAAQSGWLGALQHKQIGRAISLIHRDPAREWTLTSLAAAVAMSRSAFAARFTELVGEPAMRYVARWRMHLAVTRLKEDDASLSDLASQLGYDSEAAFSRAFKRFIGVPPGAIRRNRYPEKGVKELYPGWGKARSADEIWPGLSPVTASR
ncbi:MAG TPA: AraC family transcriptional regulator [Chthoniobacterales bacterium]|nr:AraC family transcriptional regulator [Chthoniobacterales bacterium]